MWPRQLGARKMESKFAALDLGFYQKSKIGTCGKVFFGCCYAQKSWE
jgi:hypothetical protein